MARNHMNKSIQLSTTGSTRRLAIFILLILMVAMATMLWKWAEKQGYISIVKRSFASYLQDADVFSNRSRKMLTELESEKIKIEQRLSHLEEKWQAVSELPVAKVEKLQGNSTNSTETQILGTIERLIVAADRSLQSTGDVHFALDSLRYAQELLLSTKISDASKLNKLLIEDIKQLEASTSIDIQGINQNIKELATQLDKLPLLMDDSLVEVDWLSRQDGSKPYLGLRYLREVEQDLSRLIKVEKIKDPKVSLLSPSQVLLLKENIKLQLMQARLALLIRDENNFQVAIKTTENWIRQYFDVKVNSVEDILKELKKLTSINIGVQLPNLGEILGVVYHNQLMLKGESE